ncbi:MAG: hypothetical protein A2505_06260 [Deltaproteobacteria bacterium RIFOXYD12_FULL_55_16]|nr:MAG: hypothetical protein A2505_06260 [Deltaproteobacteria bacterium RIFOXYD12_FULL_55_16]
MGDQLFLERFIWFDHEVRRQRFPNAAQLAEQFEVSGKTAQRSIEYFRDRLQAPLEYDYFKKGYFYSDSDFQLPLTRISEKELIALLISRKLISDASAGSLSDELAQVSQKLGSLLAANLPGRAHPEDAFSFRWRTINPTEAKIFQTTTSALLQGNLLTFCYQAPSASSEVIRTVEPHHMVNYMGNWHLIAFCQLRNDWRDFLLGRMTNCQIEETAFAIRAKEEWLLLLQNSFGIYQNRELFEVSLRFTPERSRWVKEEVWHEGQKDVDDHGFLVRTIPVSHEAEIMMEILKHGAQVEVLNPEWLRNKVAEEIKAAMRNYGSLLC